MKAVKDFGLLSFGDEAFEEEEKNTDFDAKGPNKGKSSHDIGDDQKLISKTIKITRLFFWHATFVFQWKTIGRWKVLG